MSNSKLHKTLFFCLIASFSHFLNGFGQAIEKSYYYQHYSYKEGLTHPLTSYLFEDSYGYLWISSLGGISKFDGKTFSKITYPESEGMLNTSASIGQYNDIICNSWEKGITLIYPDNTIQFYPFPGKYKFGGPDKKMIFSGNDICQFNLTDDNSELKGDSGIHFIHLAFSMESKTFRKILLESDTTFFYPIDSKNDTIWLSTTDGIQLLVGLQKKSFIPYKKSYIEFEAINDSLFIVLDQKKQMYSIKDWKTLPNESFLAQIQKGYDILNMLSLPDNRIVSMNWFDSQIYWIENERQIPSSVKTAFPFSMQADNNDNCWTTGVSGIFNMYQFQTEIYKLAEKYQGTFTSIEQDFLGNIFFGTNEGQLWKMDTKGNLEEIKIINATEKGENPGLITSLTDKNGRIFFFNNTRKVFIWTGENLKSFEIKGTDSRWYYDNETETVFGKIIKEGKPYLATITSDLKFEMHKEAMDSVQLNRFKEQRNAVYDGFGSTWKLKDGKIIVKDKTGKEQQLDNKKLGEDIQSLTNYNNKYMIILNRKSLNILDLNAFRQSGAVLIRQFSQADGIPLDDYVFSNISVDREGHIWLRGLDRACRIHLGKLMQKPPLKPVSTPYISGIHSSQDNANWNKISIYNDTILSWRDRFLKFEIHCAYVTMPDELMFRYRLPGVSSEWSSPQNEKQILISNIPYGTYRLEVQASIDGFDWSETGFSNASITISQPFWSTYWFFGIVGMVIVGIFGGVMYLIRRRWEEKLKEERVVDQLKLRAIRSKHIPHFTGNILSAINYMILKDKIAANEYIAAFSNFSQQTLYNAEKISRSLKEEIEYTELYLMLEKIRFTTQLEYSVVVELNVDKDTQVPVMAMHTFCENALKHGLRHKKEVGIISVHIYKRGDYTVLSVEDNGVGREKAKELGTSGTGEGLSILEQQIAIYNKFNSLKMDLEMLDLKNEDGIPIGTCFRLVIPDDYRFCIEKK